MGDVNEDKVKVKAEAEVKGEDKDQLISLREASEIYGLSTSYLRELAIKGRLEAQKVGNMWVTTPAAVETYIRTRDKRGAYREDITI